MEGFEEFKRRREQTGLSVRAFSERADISASSLFYYESGENHLYNLPVGKAVNIFSLIRTDAGEFFNLYYPELNRQTDINVGKWKSAHPRDLSFRSLKTKYRLRIAKIKERGSIPEDVVSEIRSRYDDSFARLSFYAGESGRISNENYETIILPLSYFIRKSAELHSGSHNVKEHPTSVCVNELLLHSDYTYTDLSALVGVTPRLLAKYRKDEDGYESMKTCTALSIARVFGRKFGDVFVKPVVDLS